MRKLSLIAAGVSLAMAGSAHATLDTIVDATIFMSGASAPSNMLREHTVQNVCSQAAPINVYVDVVRTNPGAGNAALANPILEHTTHWVVQCTAAAGTGANLANKTVAVYKSDVGGSGNGTTPVSQSVALPFINASTTNCALTRANQAHNGGGVYNLYTCGTATVNQIPDGGTSDIEPTKFVGTLAPASGDFVDLGNVQIKVGPGLVFGVAITKAFRDELQADQGLTVGADDEANMPSLPSSYVTSITQGKIPRWADEEVYGNAVNVPATFVGADSILGTADDVAAGSLTPLVHICRRVQGSGTHAQHMIEYHRTNCMTGSLAMPGQPGISGGRPAVIENSSSGNLGVCLDALDRGVGAASSGITPTIAAGRASFGLGYQATEKNMGLQENWRYVKVDGVAPTLENAFNGDYDQIYYLSFQNRNDNSYVTGGVRVTPADAGAINDFYNQNLEFPGSIVAAANEGFVHPWGQGGFLQPSATAPAAFNVNDPRTPWTRENAGFGADSCQPLARKR